jgi:hypothetical protein
MSRSHFIKRLSNLLIGLAVRAGLDSGTLGSKDLLGRINTLS